MSTPLVNACAKVRAEGQCRTCPSTSELTKHHLVPEGWFKSNPEVRGRHSKANLVPMCRYCHAVLEGQLPCESKRGPRAMEKRRALRATLLPSEVKFVAAVRGWAWLDHHYPVDTVCHGE